MHTILMSDLDKKLEEACSPYIDDGGNTNYIALTEAIKQAFIDEGWKPVQERINIANSHIIDQTYRQYGLMTGQEWYDKFLMELPPIGKSVVNVEGDKLESWVIKWIDVEKAAKKASGLE